MALSPWQKWRLCVGLALVAAAGPAAAQDAGNVFYSRQTGFLIPFQADPNDRRVQAVLLHVSEDLGRTYQPAASALPSERAFRFQARHDGWYWFAVQTRDTDGRAYPPNLTLLPPGIKVCVDTKPPVVALRPAAPREGSVAVEWNVSDENLDLNTLRLDYRPAGGRDWLPLAAPRLAHDQFGWSPPGGGPVEVRLQVLDKARNSAETTTTVTPGAYAPGTGVAPPAGGPAGAGAKVVHVRSRAFQLNYEIGDVGPSKVKTVEIWWTRDKRRWEKYPEEARPDGPHPIRVTAPGRYGFTLIPRSGVGLAARPPEPYEEPQVWVEVDETAPRVRVYSASVNPETGKLTVTWGASDNFLRAQPISISVAEKPDGSWVPLPGAERLDNTGTYTCSTETLPWQVYVRVAATDEAGNVGVDVFREPVKIDLKVPKVRSINISAEGPAPPAPPH
jgi:hypothetical protein